jgi:hypothetical protein
MPTTHPRKEAVRQYMQQRQAERTPPPPLDEIRRQLGWPMLEAERRAVRR